MAALCARCPPCIQSSSSGAPPSKEDLSHRLAALQLTIDDYKEGRASSAYPRTWVVARRPDPTREFTVLTLNLEADSAKDVSKLAGRRAPRCKPGEDSSGCEQAVAAALRRDPDVICLQEMQRCRREYCDWCALGHCRFNHAHKVHELLTEAGFGGEYKRDGKQLTVGVYYKLATFRRIHVGFVTFDKPQYVAGVSRAAESQKGAILALLRHAASDLPVLVASVHLDVPMSNGVPCTQQQVAGLKQLRKKMEEMLTHPKNASQGTTLDTPVVAAGDFNTLAYKSWDPRIAPPDAYVEMTRTNARARGGRGLLFKSAYAAVQGAEPPYTSVAPDFTHAIDYLFFTPRQLAPSAVLAVVEDRANLPAAPWPSDHLPLVAKFELRDAPDPTTPPSATACRFGDACIFYAKGKCRNFHPPRKHPLREWRANRPQGA